MVKNLLANAGDARSISGSGRTLGEENGNPLQDSCQEKFHEVRSLAGYSPSDHKIVLANKFNGINFNYLENVFTWGISLSNDIEQNIF